MATALNSWKEIATYLNRGVRTVQRWELEKRLPVNRIGTGPKSPVFAYKSEIDIWLRHFKSEPQAEQPQPSSSTVPGSSTRANDLARHRELVLNTKRLLHAQHVKFCRLVETMNMLEKRYHLPHRSSVPATFDQEPSSSKGASTAA